MKRPIFHFFIFLWERTSSFIPAIPGKSMGFDPFEGRIYRQNKCILLLLLLFLFSLLLLCYNHYYIHFYVIITIIITIIMKNKCMKKY